MKTVKINGKIVGRMNATAYKLIRKSFRYIHSPCDQDKLPAGFKGWVVGNTRAQRVVIEVTA